MLKTQTQPGSGRAKENKMNKFKICGNIPGRATSVRRLNLAIKDEVVEISTGSTPDFNIWETASGRFGHVCLISGRVSERTKGGAGDYRWETILKPWKP